MSDNLDKLISLLEEWGAEPKQVLEDTFIGNVDFYKSCLERFANEDLFQTLKESLVHEELDVARRIVHTMKGNADYLGLFPIMDRAMNVLSALRANNIKEAIIGIPKLESKFLELREMLNSLPA